mgnify:CR=1 FL=1
MADANIYIAGASISPTSVQTGAKYAIAVDVRNVQYAQVMAQHLPLLMVRC